MLGVGDVNKDAVDVVEGEAPVDSDAVGVMLGVGDEVADQDAVDVSDGKAPVDSDAVGVMLGVGDEVADQDAVDVSDGKAPVDSDAVGVVLGVDVTDMEALARGETLGEDELDARGVADEEALARGETLGEALGDVDCSTLMVTFATDESALPAPVLVACTTSE